MEATSLTETSGDVKRLEPERPWDISSVRNATCRFSASSRRLNSSTRSLSLAISFNASGSAVRGDVP
jgi:hypothetical protein